jgi:hypothetical protein
VPVARPRRHFTEAPRDRLKRGRKIDTDVVAFLAAERGRGLSVNNLRRAAIRHLHFAAGVPVPTGIHRAAADADELPAKKLAATAGHPAPDRSRPASMTACSTAPRC